MGCSDGGDGIGRRGVESLGEWGRIKGVGGKVVENIPPFVPPSTLHRFPFILVSPLTMAPSELVLPLNSKVESLSHYLPS